MHNYVAGGILCEEGACIVDQRAPVSVIHCCGAAVVGVYSGFCGRWVSIRLNQLPVED